MKIVVASKFYYHRAGLETYLFKIIDTLKSYGHEIIPFSTDYEENYKTEYTKFFAEYIDLSGEGKNNFYKKIKAFSRIFYNLDAKNRFSQLLDYTNPDLIWGFGIHRHLSPSVFIEAKQRSIPVIQRLSDYAIVCPESRLTKGDNTNCNELLCPVKGYFNAVKYRCIRQSKINNPDKTPSLTASIIGALELYVHNKLKLYVNNVDKFIAPSNFLRKIMIKSNIPENKITHIPIYIDPYKYKPEFSSQPYLVYFGRLSYEKGLPVLLNAMANLKHHKLLIVGDGPQMEHLKQIKEQKNLINVNFLGKLYGEQLNKVVRNSRIAVVPSTWFDNSPNVILESFALGKPVLAANIGGIPEYIEENIDGMLYQYDNQQELEEKIDFLMQQQSLCEEMGRAARKKVELKYNPDTHYTEIMRIIREIK
ncbi:MAG: glycosyltransferase family 4 protein [bacterium]